MHRDSPLINEGDHVHIAKHTVNADLQCPCYTGEGRGNVHVQGAVIDGHSSIDLPLWMSRLMVQSVCFVVCSLECVDDADARVVTKLGLL